MKVGFSTVSNYNQSKKDNEVNFKGKLNINLPKDYLKVLDVYNNASGKELKSVKSFVDFVKNYFGKAVKVLTPKDDVYELKIGAFEDSEPHLSLFFEPGEKSKRRGIKSDCLSLIDRQDMFRHKLAQEKSKIMAHFPNRTIQRAETIIKRIKENQATSAKQKDLQLREKLLKQQAK